MKERRIKALNGLKGMDAAIVDKIVVYDENGNQVDCCTIKTDDDGREYYLVGNPCRKNRSFTNRPKDAIDCIKKGYGDAIRHSWLLGFSFEHVVRYLNRSFGEDLRQKTIEGFKDTKFAYAVQFNRINSMSGGRSICKNKSLYCYLDGPEDVLTFESEEAANMFIEEIVARATKYAEDYNNLPTNGDSQDYQNIVKPFFKKIESEMESGSDSVYWHVFSALDDEKNDGKKAYSLEVIQVIVP